MQYLSFPDRQALNHLIQSPTNPFPILELYNPSHDVPEPIEIRWAIFLRLFNCGRARRVDCPCLTAFDFRCIFAMDCQISDFLSSYLILNRMEMPDEPFPNFDPCIDEFYVGQELGTLKLQNCERVGWITLPISSMRNRQIFTLSWVKA